MGGLARRHLVHNTVVVITHVSPVPDVLAILRATGVESVLVEGGAEVTTSLIAVGLVDRVVVALAPIILGNGIQAVNDLGTRTIGSALQLRNQVTVQLGDDTIIAGDVTDRA